MCASEPGRMYAVLGAAQGGGVYRSDDGGEHWRLVNADPRLWGRDGDFNEVKVDPKNADVLYVANVVTWKSTDGGRTFTAFRGAPGGDDYHRLWINPDDPKIILLAGDQGAVVTVNGGATWSSWYNQPTAQFYHVSTDHQFPYRVYGGQQESGSAGIVSRGNDGQITFREWRPVGAEEYGYVAPDPLHPDIVYGGKISRFDWSTGQVQVDGRHADRAHAVEQGLAHGGLALRHAGRLRRREPLSPRRPPPPYLPHQGRRKDVDRGRRGHAVERGRERGARRPGAAGIAVCRDGAERVRVVRRRGALAIAAARSAGELGARPRRGRHPPGRGDAWTLVLEPRRHHPAAPGRGGRRCRRGGRPLSVPPGARRSSSLERQHRHAAPPRRARGQEPTRRRDARLLPGPTGGGTRGGRDSRPVGRPGAPVCERRSSRSPRHR